MTETLNTRSAAIKEQARMLGLDACGIAEAAPLNEDDHFTTWIQQGYHAEMAWLARNPALRNDIHLFLPKARSVIVVASNYYLDPPQSPPQGAGSIARYAWGRDYHKILQRRLRALTRFIQAIDQNAESRSCVDSGPVMERAWAARAGLGWLGKHGLLIHRRWGSWILLGVLATSIPLAPDQPVANACGDCQRCMTACPTKALVQPGVLDARRCIAYHTIENRGDIPPEFHTAIGDRLFGCDRCQEVCPWNQRGENTEDPDFQAKPAVLTTIADDFLTMDPEEFDHRFAGMALRRAKLEGIRRNARIVIANRQDENGEPRDCPD